MVQPFPHKGPPQMWSYVAASRYRSTCIVALPLLAQASKTVEKAVSCYKVDQLVASFLRVQFSLAVSDFCAAGEELCKWGHGRVCVKLWCLMSWCPKHIRTIGAIWDQQIYLWIHTNLAGWAVTRRTLKYYETVKMGVGACAVMGACPGQYGGVMLNAYLGCLLGC